MKALALAFLVISANAFHVAETRASQSPVHFFPAPSDPYDLCFELLEKILRLADELIVHINAQEWQKVVPLMLKITKDIYDDIQCWVKPPHTALGLDTNPSECFLQHIQGINKNIMLALLHIWSKEYKKVPWDLSLVVDHILALPDCFALH